MGRILIRTLWIYFKVGLVMATTVPLLLIFLIFLPEHRRKESRGMYRVLDWWYRGVLWMSGMEIYTEGFENMPTDPAIVIGNHQSSVDIPLMGLVMQGIPHRWYILAYYARMPFFGFFVRRLCFPLERAQSTKVAHDFLRGVRYLASCPCHIIIFPEGTRHADRHIHPFFRGFAVLARMTGRVVVPVFMPYNSEVYPPATFWIYKHRLVVVVGPAMVLQPGESDRDFVHRVEAWYAEQERRFPITKSERVL